MDTWGVLRRGLALSVIVGAMWIAAPAQAASTISVSSNPGVPAGVQPFTLTVSGDNQDASGQVGVQISIAPSPHTCADQQGNDSGSYVLQLTYLNGTGPYSVSASPITEPHGSYVVCGWLFDGTTETAVVQTSLNLTISNPSSISFSVSPNPTYPGRYTTVSASGYADQGIDVYVTQKPATAGASCAPTPSQDSGTQLYTDNDLGAGPWSDDGSPLSNLSVGSELLCGWVLPTGAANTTAPFATTQTQLVVRAPSYSLSLSSPGSVKYFHTVTVLAKWHADVPAELFVTAMYRWKRACPSNRWNAPYRSSVDLVSVDNGGGFNDNFAQVGASLPTDPVSGTLRVQFPPASDFPASTYVVCGWLQQIPTGNGNPMATPAVSGPVSLKITLRPPVTFSGRDSQGQKTGFSLNGRTIIGMNFYPHANCTRVGRQWDMLNFPNFRARRNGAFSFVGGSPGQSLRVRLYGHIYRRYASGWFIATWHDSGIYCNTGRVTFRFTRHGG